jgi:hypothetical protein
MTPTLQASDLDVEGLVGHLSELGEEIVATAKSRAFDYACDDAGVASYVNEGEASAAVLAEAASALQSLSAQLAAEKARADKAEGRWDQQMRAAADFFAKWCLETDARLSAERRAEAAEANLLTATKALDNSNSLFAAMLHEERPHDEIEEQIVENRDAIRALSPESKDKGNG